MRSKLFFASDFHLGAGTHAESSAREKKIVEWLESIGPDALEVFLVGDVFDFWFEYRKAIPKGYTRLFGSIARLSDAGVQFHFFTGNHDLWVRNYFEEELGMKIYHRPEIFERFGKKYFVGHGDGLGPADYTYKVMKAILTNPVCQWLFARIHPNTGLTLMRMASKGSREFSKTEAITEMDKEWLVAFCEAYIDKKAAPDYFIFGHRHLPIEHRLSNGKSVYYNLGEWWNSCTYLEVSPKGCELRSFIP